MKAISFRVHAFLICCFAVSFVLPLQGQSSSGVISSRFGTAFIQPDTGLALPAIAWDRDNAVQTVICGDSSIYRFYLIYITRSGAMINVKKVFFSGADSSEWYILGDQLGKLPLQNFTMHSGDTIWVDVVFKPELNKSLLQKYADRLVQLIASVDSEPNQIISLTGHVHYATPVTSPDSIYLIYKGYTASISTYLTDTGTAPLVIESIGPLTYPITNIGIRPGDTIFPGQQNGKHVVIQIMLTAPLKQDTTIYLELTFQSSCAGSKLIPIQIKYVLDYVERTSQQLNNFSIRPNPVRGNSLLLTVDKPIVESTEIKIFDVLGREIYKRNIFNESSFQIPIGNLQNGIYYARLNIGGKIKTEKFEVIR